jgi:RimJ/RimL family protein N-acetyltransferase
LGLIVFLIEEVDLPNSIALRLATQADCRQLLDWRNDPITVAMSLVAEPVSWENHVRWFESVLANPNRHLLVAEDTQIKYGTVRFDEVDDTAEISITVSPDLRGQGVGSKLLDAADVWAKNELGLDRIIAQIKANNPASIALFKKCGYEITEEGDVLSLVKYL